MKIQFCGAAQTVTGSNHLITLDNGHRILLDCGLYQGRHEEMEAFNRKWKHYDPADIDFVIISHAHIDHIGRLPRLVKDGFNGQILCTHATRSLAAIMLLDSAKIHVEDAGRYNETPLYTKKDVHDTLRMITGLSYERWHFVEVGLEVFFTDSGHILGSASVTLKIEEAGKEPTLIGFSGDVGRPERPILRDPQPMPAVDYLICESTYGAKLHKDLTADKRDLLLIVRETCLLNEGKLLIPAFSLGRTQELIYMLDQLETEGELPHIPVYVDSPLAISAVDIFQAHPECYDTQLQEYLQLDKNPFGFKNLKFVRKGGLADRLKHDKRPCIIISASGMMNAGRVVRHLYHLLGNSKNTVLAVGYCAPYTLGGALVGGKKEVFIHGKKIKVRAKIQRMLSFSAHADQNELLDFLQNQTDLKQLYLVHGEYHVQRKFREYLFQRGFDNIEIPALGQEFNI